MVAFRRFECRMRRMFRNSGAIRRVGRKSLLRPLSAGKPSTLQAGFLEFRMSYVRVSKGGEDRMTTDGLSVSYKASTDVD